MKQQFRFIIFFVLTLIDSSFQETLGENIKNIRVAQKVFKKLIIPLKNPLQEGLTSQINKLAISLSDKILINYEPLSLRIENPQTYYQYDFITYQNSYDTLNKIYLSTGQKIKFIKSFLSLPQFFILNEIIKIDITNLPSNYEQDIGSDYSKCILCSGQYFFIDGEYFALHNDVDYPPAIIVDELPNVWRYHNQETKTQEYMVGAFQTLWNCNNPDDTLQITKIFDEQTKNKLYNSPFAGFDKICNSCDDSFCKQCQSDYTTCLSCVEGYDLINGKCVGCENRIQNCSKCSKNNTNEDICQECQQNYYLLNQNCVKQCPEGTYTGKSSCVTCTEAQYFNGESCQSCSNYCKKCSGPSGKDCSECYFGFIQQKNECIACQDDSKCPGAVCKSNQFRSLKYPFNCEECDAKCKTCSNSGPMNCLTCHEKFRLVSGRCSNVFYKPSTYPDPITGQIKQCNFSCSECEDSTNRCKECNPDLNYFVKDGDRQICYFKCPKNYITNDSDLSQDFYECKLSDSYTEDQKAADRILEEAKQRCSDYNFWDEDSSSCKKCVNRCLSCTAKDSCNECAPGYYWDEQQYMCLACHNSCKKCTGPLFSQCILCKDVSKMYPNTKGVCDVTAQSQAPILTKVPTSLEIFGDLKICQASYNDKLNRIYTVKIFQTFTSQDDAWKDTELISTDTSCTFDDFKKVYSSLKDNTSKCESINKSTMSTKGQMTVIYAVLLNQSGVKLEGKDLNPGSLAKYAIENSKYSTYHIYKPRGKFSCDRLSCESSLDNFMNGFDRGRGQTVAIKSTDEIVFTSNGQQINCHESSIPTYDEEPLKELEQTVSQARISVNTNSKVYFILDACVTGSNGKQTKKTFLATDFYENGFVRALDVESQTEEEKYNIFFIQGAFKSQNEYLKKCNPLYKNKFESYLVTRIKKVEVQYQNIEVNKAEAQANQIAEKNNSNETDEKPKVCSCIKTKEYILQNEDQGGELYKVISPQDTILTKSIKVSSVTDILKKNKLDPVKMKANKISISTVLAYKMFDQYLDKITKTANSCYGISSSSNQCIQNILIDIVFSNNGLCVNSAELKSAALKNDFAALIKIIQSSPYCKTQKARCNKHVQVLKGCQ